MSQQSDGPSTRKPQPIDPPADDRSFQPGTHKEEPQLIAFSQYISEAEPQPSSNKTVPVRGSHYPLNNRPVAGPGQAFLHSRTLGDRVQPKNVGPCEQGIANPDPSDGQLKGHKEFEPRSGTIYQAAIEDSMNMNHEEAPDSRGMAKASLALTASKLKNIVSNPRKFAVYANTHDLLPVSRRVARFINAFMAKLDDPRPNRVYLMYFVPVTVLLAQVSQKLSTFGNINFLQRIDELNSTSAAATRIQTGSKHKKAFYKVLFSFADLGAQEAFYGIRRMRVSGVHVKIGDVRDSDSTPDPKPSRPISDPPSSPLVQGNPIWLPTEPLPSGLERFESGHFLKPTQFKFHQGRQARNLSSEFQNDWNVYCFRVNLNKRKQI